MIESWTVFKLKKVNTADKYYWMQPSVFVEWNIPPQQTPTDSRNPDGGAQPTTNSNNAPGVQRVFFVNLPLDEQRSIQKNFPSRYLRYYNPYIWHAVFAREVAMLYDKCFWSLRHLVRDIEKVCNHSSVLLLLPPFNHTTESKKKKNTNKNNTRNETQVPLQNYKPLTSRTSTTSLGISSTPPRSSR